MEIILKLLLSTTILYVINFVFKTLTSNHFDKIFVPKHQKALQSICVFLLFLIVFIFYGFLIATFYEKIKKLKYIVFISDFLFLIYFIGLVFILCICLIKWIKEGKGKDYFNLSEQKSTVLNFFSCPVEYGSLFYNAM
ncbi:hypothetical protein ACFQY3_19195 [Paenibacillus farraposensis]|uniref:hypothetical protein n=1 Tax=Paenibacillus farraposensis TaxID=2807095 RepID=UPI001E2A937C|nr:hypothetical protein [Paenibacillus farraposensis]MCC3380758.1 hypothetical protein [Paenibacillus farraposensis]